jgi:flavin-dependent dehydrogenase
MIRPADQPDPLDYDVVVIGGSISGSGTALALLGEEPTLRILLVERLPVFDRRVGESTVELSTYYLTRILGLTRYLNENHIVKQGFRYWFTSDAAESMGCCTEMGGRYLTRVGSFQVDRAELDDEVLRRASQRGAEVCRPATVKSIGLMEGGTQTLVVQPEGGPPRTVTCRWVVDASGRKAMIARQRDEVTPLEGHPTAAVWARFQNTLDFDSPELVEQFPALGEHFYSTRHTATNHLMGDGWWAWVIPLKDGHTSVGIVWDQRLFQWPREIEGGLGAQLRAVLESHPTGRELLRDATMVEGDVHIRRNLPYTCATPAGDGFVLVGDANGFIDPFYSMGLDHLAMTSLSGTQIILAERRGEAYAERIAKHNDTFRQSLPKWFEGIFRDKYVYMGDYDLMRVAFLIDIGLYYFGLIAPPYQRGRQTILDGMFYPPAAQPFYWFMRWVNHRMTSMAVVRRRRGTFGKNNTGRRMLIGGFAFDVSIAKAVGRALWGMLKLEVTEGWRCWRPARDAHGSVVLPHPPATIPAATRTPPEAEMPAPAPAHRPAAAEPAPAVAAP